MRGLDQFTALVTAATRPGANTQDTILLLRGHIEIAPAVRIAGASDAEPCQHHEYRCR